MQAIQELWELIEIWELQNSIWEVGKWDKLVDEKPPNPMGDWIGKPTSWKRATLNKSLCSNGLGQTAEEPKRSIDKKSPNPSAIKRGKSKDRGSKKEFFGDSPEHALPLQREFKQFNYCGYQVARWIVTFLEVPQDRVGFILTKREVTAFVSSTNTVERVISCTKER